MAAIIADSGVNFTLYYNVLNYFKTIMKNHPSIGVATYGDFADFDTREFPKYPVANLQILDTDFGTNTTNYSIQLTVADKVKNKNNESVGERNEQTIPFYGVDDVVDIHANTLAIINDLTSYTQRSVQGFEINTDIVCEPFQDRFNNGLAGWVSNFTLTTHNDKNRCLFFLISPELTSFIVEDCLTGQRYRATINETLYSIGLGGVFSTLRQPGLSPTYGNLVCYSIVDVIDNVDDIQLSNLPILQPGPIVDCPTCNLWINPKVWSTTPAAWSGPDAEFRTWATV